MLEHLTVFEIFVHPESAQARPQLEFDPKGSSTARKVRRWHNAHPAKNIFFCREERSEGTIPTQWNVIREGKRGGQTDFYIFGKSSAELFQARQRPLDTIAARQGAAGAT